ncbi:hypothetical protein V501_01088 [Pseudogymnoascus sp. VKM F-4519 (FW-2642)]|nr:hypothetical protein V501_01088 [Pseudogymnoascus sp. VKM F-4519 (FW-2642)]
MAKPPSSAQETSSPIPTQPTYLLMRYGTTGITSRHTIEIAAIFGMDWGDTANANIVPAVMNYWISFIRSLNPNTYKYASAPQWENLGTGFDGGKRLKFETNATVIETIPADQVQRCICMVKNVAEGVEDRDIFSERSMQDTRNGRQLQMHHCFM